MNLSCSHCGSSGSHVPAAAQGIVNLTCIRCGVETSIDVSRGDEAMKSDMSSIDRMEKAS